MGRARDAERATNRKLESKGLPPVSSRAKEDPSVWFGLDDAGHRNARNLRDLAKAIRQRNFPEAEVCLDMLARDDHIAREEIALGRQAA